MNRTNRPRVTTLVLVAIVAICVMNVWVIPQHELRLERQRHARVAAEIRGLREQLEKYKIRNAAYPTTQQGLLALGVTRKDPWLSDYVYRCPGSHDKKNYDLFSSGADRKPDTLDDDWGQ